MRLPTFRSLLLGALPAFAMLAAAPAAADSLEVHVGADIALPAAEVKAAIAAELGAAIVDTAPDLGAIDIWLDGDKLAVSHRRPDGTQLVRVVALPALPADRLALIAFVTGNLVRDQLADLRVAQATAVAPAPLAPTPVGPAAATPIGPVVAPPTVTIVPTPVVASAQQVTEAPEVTVPLSIGVVPWLSTDRFFGSRARVRGALNLVAGASSSIDGVSISGAADLSANVRGLQIGGAISIGRDTEGMQIGGAATIARDLRGIQIAGAATVARNTTGIQIAGAGAAARDFRGIQVAGAGTIARNMRGIQIAGASTVAADATGLQIAGGAAVTGQIEGAQISSINIAGTMRGLQIGAINVAGHAHGLQLGAINISDDSDGAQIGALNFVRHGRVDIDAWAETTGLAAIALRHGGRYVHNVYAVGFTPDGKETPLVGLGLGVHRPLGNGMFELDAMSWQTHLFKDGVGLLAQARATFALPLGPVDGFVAAAYNVSVEDHGEEAPVRTVFARTIGEPMSSSVDVALWPSLAAGVRGHFGAR